jgi:ABC-type bacteriocin/lantibiotic exporter with double-glycine peptidase domain
MKKTVLISSISRIQRILPAKFKRKSFFVVILLLLNAILELAGIGALIPFLIAIVEKNSLQSGWLAEFYEFTGFESPASFILALGLTIFMFIILKNILGLLISKFQANYSFGLYSHFAQSMQKEAYQRGFSFFSSTNSNVIFRDINIITLNFAQSLVLPLLNFLTEVVIIALIVIGIILYDYRAVFLMLLLVPFFIVFYRLVRKKIVSMSLEVNDLQATTYSSLYQSIFGYVDVVMNNNEEWFFDQYQKHVSRLKELRAWQFVYNLMPSKVIESTVILAVLMIMAYGFSFLESRSELVMLLGVFGVAAYRVIPSINRMMMALMNIRSYQYTIGVMERVNSIDDKEVMSESVLAPLSMINNFKIKRLSFAYEGSDVEVLSKIDLEIRRGETVGVIGKSGSGKTTLMNLMLGFLKPDSGTIEIDNVSLDETNIRNWRETAGYVRQEVFLVDGTLAENIALGFAEVDRKRVSDVAKKASLTGLIESLSNGIDTPVGERGAMISGGQRQRVGIARALYSGAKVLFFDEATSALDSETEEEITEAINHLSDEKVTIVIVAHRHSTLKYCDRIYELEEGRVKAIYDGYKDLVK